MNKFDGTLRWVELQRSDIPEYAEKIAQDFVDADRVMGLEITTLDTYVPNIIRMVTWGLDQREAENAEQSDVQLSLGQAAP